MSGFARRFASAVDVQAVVDLSQTAQNADFANSTNAAKGAGLDGFNPTLNYVAQTLGRSVADREWNPRDFPWLAKFDGVTDDTQALLACMTALYNAGGGTMVMPRGTGCATSIVFNFAAANRPVTLRGQGQGVTILKKIGATTTPVLEISGTVGILETHADLRDFTVSGLAKAHHGVRATNIARFSTTNLAIDTCNVGWESLGCLIVNHHAPEWRGNNIGYRCRKSGAVYSNLVQFFGGCLSQNTLLGVDIGEGYGHWFHGTDIEQNGTPGDLTTGAVRIRSTVAVEIGYATIGFYGAWFEGNKGDTFVVESSNLNLTIQDCPFIGSEAGRALNVGAIRSVVLQNVFAGSAGDVVTLNADNSTVIGGHIATLNDTSTHRAKINNTNIAPSTGTVLRELEVTGDTLINSPYVKLAVGTKVLGGGAFVAGAQIVAFQDRDVAGNTHAFFHSNGLAGNAAACGLRVGTNSTTGRSVNAGGTVNVAGADYAEYETLAAGQASFAAGDLVGFDTSGRLTHLFASAIGFGIKSTAPGFVGGDAWSNGLQADALEAARLKVERIAYCGKVPCNVTATPGQWIVAAADSAGRIVGVASSAPTSDELLRLVVGRVRNIGTDGRPIVVVRP